MPWYEVSSEGRVRVIARADRWGIRPLPVPRDYRPLVNGEGYLCVSRALLNRCVLLAFVGPPPVGKNDASHLDGDHLNNRLQNLVWESRRDNLLRKRTHGTDKRGSKSHLAKLTEEQAIDILARVRAGERPREIARRYGVDASVVSRIKSGHRWSHLHK